MRVARVALAAALLLAFSWPVAGQAAAPTTPVLTELAVDATADAKVGAAGQASNAPDDFDQIDLVSLKALETDLDVQFTLAVANLAATSGGAGTTTYEVFFRHNDRQFSLRIAQPGLGSAGGAYRGDLAAYDPGTGFYRTVTVLPVTVNAADSTMAMAVPREYLADAQGAAPYPGRLLDEVWARGNVIGFGDVTITGAVTVPTPDASDRMPDEGFSPTVLPILLGLAQSGHAHLSSDEPFRASNGEASTFLFRLNATNKGDQADAFGFHAVGLPAGWSIQMPDLLRIEAGQTLPVQAVVRTAFAHDHGGTASFVVEMQSESDSGSVGRIKLGLRYPLIAQPAGHHNQLYLHSQDFGDDPVALALGTGIQAALGGSGARSVYFNTATPDEDERDDGAAVQGGYCYLGALDPNDTVSSGYCWTFPLDPGLELGLDFDLAATGTITVPLSSLYPAPGMRIEGELVYLPPVKDPDDQLAFFNREEIVVATIPPTARVDMLVNQQATFTGMIVPTAEGDLIGYVRGAALELRLTAKTARPDNFYLGPKLQPELLPGGSLTLPLKEYEDPIQSEFGATSLAAFKLEGGEANRQQNPGQTSVFNLTLHNDAGKDHKFRLALYGSNLEWGRISAGLEQVEVPAGGAVAVQVAVTVPAGALDGERADLVVEAASTTDLAVRALTRLVTSADTEGTHADESGAVQAAGPAKDSPAPPAALLLAALAALAVARRRRAT